MIPVSLTEDENVKTLPAPATEDPPRIVCISLFPSAACKLCQSGGKQENISSGKVFW